jgi:hypothetical protein
MHESPPTPGAMPCIGARAPPVGGRRPGVAAAAPLVERRSIAVHFSFSDGDPVPKILAPRVDARPVGDTLQRRTTHRTTRPR